MRTDLDHLPGNKQRELERVIQIVFEEFEEALGLATNDWKKKGRILKVILYGSYARGGWVDEPHTAKGYQSDYDLLLIVNDRRLTDRVEYWSKLEDRLNREFSISGALRTPVNFIVHSLQEVNDGLAQGRYFFMDLARDGIALYQADDTPLLAPRPKTPEAALALAQEYFDEWFPSASDFYEGYSHAKSRGKLKKAAFDLHQATERLYHCALLTISFYTPHVHNVGFLRTQVERLDRRFCFVWPKESKEQRALFVKLKEAYVKARYSRHYQINDEELEWMAQRVTELSSVTEEVCLEHIARIRSIIYKNLE